MKRICIHPRTKSRRVRALAQRQAQLAILETDPTTKVCYQGLSEKQIKAKIYTAKQDIKNLKERLHV